MIKEQIKELENIVNKEIDGYKNIRKLYADKREMLIHGKVNDLFDIDARISDTYKNINDCSEARKKMAQTMDIKNYSLTDIINKIKTQDEEAAKKFEAKKAEVSELAQNIFKLEKVNLELLKHGMHVTNKTLEIILKGIKPVTEEYNKQGKNITKKQLEMSSIVEEA